MEKPIFFHDQRSVIGQQPVPTRSIIRTGIEIDWGGMLTRALKMRRSFINAEEKAHLIRLKQGCQEGHLAQLAGRAEAQKNCASSPASRPA